MFNLPKNCEVNRFIPKKTFYEKIGISTTIKNEFVNLIDKIVWKYKLSQDTLGVNKTEKIEEIQIFEVNLKEKKIPKNIIKVIAKAIPYQILFVIRYNDDFCYSIKVDDIYFTDWNENINIIFDGLSLETIYENIVKSIIKETKTKKDFEILLQDKNKQIELNKKLEQLKNKMKAERQFNKKVELNKQIKQIEQELEVIVNG